MKRIVDYADILVDFYDSVKLTWRLRSYNFNLKHPT